MKDPAFYGCEAGLKALQAAYESPKAEAVLIYGRRRTGKTALIQKFGEGKPVFFYTAKPWKPPFQLERLSNAVSAYLETPGVRYLEWPAAIRGIAARKASARQVIVIEEFQHLAQERPDFCSELLAAWNESRARENILLILSSGDMPFVRKEILGGNDALRETLRTIITMAPLPFNTVSKFAPSYSASELFRGYAVLGGSPYRWEVIDPGLSMTENLAASLVRVNGFLYDETQAVLREEFRNPATYNAILHAMALGAETRPEIAWKSLTDVRTVARYLDVLEERGLVVQEPAIFEGLAGKKPHPRFQIADRCMAFWFRFLATRPALVMTREEALAEWAATVEPGFDAFAAESFRKVCRTHLVRLFLSEKRPFRLQVLCGWRNRKTVIDSVGIDAEIRRGLVCDCQYKEEKTGMGSLRSLRKKISGLPFPYDVDYDCWLFSKSGFHEALQDEASKDSRIHLVGMDQLLE